MGQLDEGDEIWEVGMDMKGNGWANGWWKCGFLGLGLYTMTYIHTYVGTDTANHCHAIIAFIFASSTSRPVA